MNNIIDILWFACALKREHGFVGLQKKYDIDGDVKSEYCVALCLYQCGLWMKMKMKSQKVLPLGLS